jgi:Tfp pilus assembly protein PilZ
MPSNQKQFSASGITARLFEIISEMNDSQKIDLLVMIGDQRQYQRSPYLMQVVCETDENRFTDFILDISAGGLFLETIQELFVGQKLKLTIKFKELADPMLITGSVVWTCKNGTGIRFLFDNKAQKRLIMDQIERLG